MPDIIIVGGGVIGCSTAYYLAREGFHVTILERGDIASEASGAAAGMLALWQEGDPKPAFDALCRASLAEYDALLPGLAETGIDVRLRRSGVLHLALSEADAEELRCAFEIQTGTKHWLDAVQLRHEEPQATPRAVAAVLSPDDQHLDPRRLTQAFAEAARRYGAEIETHSPVIGFQRSGARVGGVRTAYGTYEADSVLLAGGPWTSFLAKRLGARLPVYPVRGQMLSLAGPATPLRHMIWGGYAYLVPREDGQTYVGATIEEVGFRKRTTSSALTGLRRRASALVPALKGTQTLSSWAGLRPGTPDGLPILGRLVGWQNVWVATGHLRSGILLAPITGLLMAHSITANRSEPALEPFAPGSLQA